MSEAIMKFEIDVDPQAITELKSEYGAVSIIPFTGRVRSALFSGEIRPGGTDVQIENPAGLRRLCAKYIFQGKDYTGQDCLLFVENVGFLTGEEKPGAVLRACPRFLTDSRALGEYFSQARFRSELHAETGRLEIWVFDVLREKEEQA